MCNSSHEILASSTLNRGKPSDYLHNYWPIQSAYKINYVNFSMFVPISPFFALDKTYMIT